MPQTHLLNRRIRKEGGREDVRRWRGKNKVRWSGCEGGGGERGRKYGGEV